MTSSSRLTEEQLNQVRIFIHRVGCDLVACYSKLKDNKPKTNWFKEKWVDGINFDEYDEARYEKLLLEGWYDDGVCIVNGLIRRGPLKGKYITTLDFDTKAAFERFCKIFGTTLEGLAKSTRVEWHHDDDSIHVLLITSTPFKNVKLNGLEVRADNLLTVVSPSIHPSGMAYEVYQRDNESIVILDAIDKRRMESVLEVLIRELTGDKVGYHPGSYDQPEESRHDYIEYLELPTTKVYAGERHNATVAMAASMFLRYANGWANLSDNERYERLVNWHHEKCVPPMFDEPGGETEVREIWRSACRKFEALREERFEARKKSAEGGNGQPKKDGESEEKQKPKSQATVLVELMNGREHKLFVDQYGTACVRVKVKDHYELMFVQSSRFKDYLGKLYYSMAGGVVCSDVLNDVARHFRGIAVFDGEPTELHLRTAWALGKKNEEIHYDLTDSLWRCVSITKYGWEIKAHEPNCLFTRFNQKPQVEPDDNSPSDIFDEFLDLMHIKDAAHRILTKVWIVAGFIPEFPHPIDVTHGEKGSLKSTLCRYKKRLIDPDKMELLTLPRDKSEFVQQLYHNYAPVYENVRYIPPWFSDEACRGVTGAGSTKRGLYTNDEDVIYNYRRVIVVNGINNVLTEPDALDRCLLSDFDRLVPGHRRTESDVDEEFEEMRPKLLGYIFDVLTKAIEIRPTLKLRELPRMADFAVWGESIARAMGYKNMQFMDAYYENIGKQNVEAIESSSLGRAMTKLVDGWYKEGEGGHSCCWQGSPSDLISRLNIVAESENLNTNSRTWPRSPRSLSRRLKPLTSNLREGMGIDVSFGKINSGQKRNTVTLTVRKISPLSPLMAQIDEDEGEDDEECVVRGDRGDNFGTEGGNGGKKEDFYDSVGKPESRPTMMGENKEGGV